MGPEGPQGLLGPQGIQGVQGLQGVPGADGATGPAGLNAPVYRQVTLLAETNGLALSNASNAGTEVASGASRSRLDLGQFSSVRAQFAVDTASAAVRCRLEFSTDDGATWATLIAAFAATASADANNTSAWTNLPAAANREVLVRAMILGNGTLDPRVRYVRLDLE
jgi:hypothetical protein